MSNTAPTLNIRRLSGALGAAIEGMDLAKPIDSDTMTALRQAFLQNLVLVFPGQGHITPQQHVAFAARWGDLQVMTKRHIEGCPELIEIASRGGVRPGDERAELRDHPSAKLARTDIWHTDQSYEPHPAIGSLLLARELPSVGGDTMFANQYLAFESLSAGMQALLRSVRAIHSGDGYYRITGLDPADAPETAQPAALVHPETGQTALYVNRVWTTRFEGMTVDESAPLLNYLYAHAVEPAFTFRHRWTVGDLVIWDNRCVQHYAIADYGTETRIMHRATIKGSLT